jgi:hypothetical protein
MADQTQTQPKKRGCFFYGCITALVLFVLMTLVLVFGTRYAIHTMIDGLTEEQPTKITRVELPAPRLEEILKRVDAFKKSLDDPKGGYELVLTAEEFNALIGSSPDMAVLKDRLYVHIDEDKLKADLSWPLDDLAHFPFGRFKGRYLNGSASLNAELKNGQLDVKLDSLMIKGKPVDGRFMTQLKSHNLARDITKDPKQAAAISKFDSVQIKDGKIIIKVRPSEESKKGVESI